MLQIYVNSFKLQKKDTKKSLHPSANVKKSIFLKNNCIKKMLYQKFVISL